MLKKFKITLILSLVLNSFFLLAGTAYAIKKFTTPVSSGTPFHEIKKSQFSVLPSNEDIVFAGDSITNYGNWHELLNTVIKNRGIPGDKTDGLLDNIENITEGNPKQIFLMVGINDLSNGASIEDTIENYEKIIDKIIEQTPSSKLIIQSVLPINLDIIQQTQTDNDMITEFNKKLEKLASENNVEYVDLYSNFISDGQLDESLTIDGIHLSGEGYLVWRDMIESYVNMN